MKTRSLLQQATLLFTAALTGLALPAFADEIVCRSGDQQRIISVEYERAGSPVPCRVRYDKPDEGGTTEYPWNAQGQAGYCEERAGFLASKLEGWGWTCTTTSSAPAADTLNM